jgi:hypothetical protein
LYVWKFHPRGIYVSMQTPIDSENAIQIARAALANGDEIGSAGEKTTG